MPLLSSDAPSAPRMMFSSTVKFSTSMKCWCTMPMPAAMASFGVWMEAFWPLTKISPLSAW